MSEMLRTLFVSVIGIGLAAGVLADADTIPSGIASLPDSNRLIVTRSSALQPFVEQVANHFISEDNETRILLQSGGSSVGLAAVTKGRADIGFSEVSATEEPSIDSSSLVNHKVAVVGVSVVVNPSVTITDLTTQQLVDIYTRKITNWKQVGGPDLHIMLISRSRSSGTRVVFDKYALNGAQEADIYALLQDSSDSMRKMVSVMKGAVGYLALPYVDETVRKVAINGIEATPDNIANGSYPLWSYAQMYTRGQPTDLAQEFIAYALSTEAQSALPQLGYIPINEMRVER